MPSSPRRPRWIAVPSLVLLAACSPDLQVPEGAQISCGDDVDCPAGYRCNGSTDRCVPADASDLQAPVVLELEVLPEVGGVAATGFDAVALRLVVDEPLAGAPRVYFTDGAQERSFGPLALAAAQPGVGHAYEASYVPTGAETQASFGLSAALEDAVGNRFEGPLPASVAFDFELPELLTTPAELAPEVVLLPDPVENPLAREVVLVTRVANPTTRLLVSFTVSEDVETPALRTEPATDLAFQLFGRAGNTWTFEVDWAGTSADLQGTYDLLATLVDAAGNASDVTLEGAALALDTVPPAVPTVDVPRAVRLVRTPWGDADSARVLSLEGEAGAVEPGGWVLVYGDAGATREIGRAQASASGAFGGPDGTPRFLLASGDLDRVWVRAADGGGNLSEEGGGGATTLVRDVLWIANLAGKVAGDPVTNPHRAFSTPYLAPFLDQRLSGELGGDAIGRRDGSTADVGGGGSWWELDVRATAPDGRTQAGMTFDPVHGTMVLAGGLREGSGNSGPPTCRVSPYAYANSFPFLQRGFERNWHEPTQSGLSQAPNPSAARLVFDGTRGVVMLRNGGQFRWDGAAWARECTAAECTGDLGFEPRESTLYYDPVANRVGLVGNAGFGADLYPVSYAWDGTRWSATCAAQPCLGTRPTGQIAAAAYDDGLGELVAFGLGADGRETWSFDGDRWEQLCTGEPCLSSRPPARVKAAMAHDRARGGLVLFGGDSPTNPCSAALLQYGVPAGAPPPDPAFGDTWVFDGSTWSSRPGAGPAPRYGHAMAYDALRERVILYGGTYCDCYAYQGYPAVHGDVWEWNGAAWSVPASEPITAGWYAGQPPGSSHHAMALDPRSGRVVMEGGKLGTNLWGFTNGQWFARANAGFTGRNEVPIASPTPWGAASPVGPVLFSGAIDGGFAPTDPLAFTLDVDTWQPACGGTACESTAPPPRYLHAMASDGTGLVLFGGSSWVPEGSGGGPPVGGPYGHSLGDTWRLDVPTGWTPLCTTSPCADARPTARAGHAMAHTGTPGEVLLFGGAGSMSGALGDTWLWGGGRWRQGTSVESPAPRAGHTLVRDPEREVDILYGGTDDPGSDYTGNPVDGYFVDASQHAVPPGYEEIWEWQADTWRPVPSLAPRAGDTPPGARFFHGADWEPQSGGMLVYGGSEPPGTFLWGVDTSHGGSDRTWLWRPETEGRPALVARFNAATAGGAVRPLVQAIEVRWFGEAAGRLAGAPVTSAALRLWDRTGWRTLEAAGCGAGCAAYDSRGGTRPLDPLALQRFFAGDEVLVAVLPEGTNGNGLDRARLRTDYLELGLWYRLP